MKSLARFFKSFQNIFTYSDSELLEFVICLVLVGVNPMRAFLDTACLPTFWSFIGLLGGMVVLWGLGTRSVKCREVGMLLALVNLTALNVIELRHYHLDPGYLLQNAVIAFTWWKLGKERMAKEFRGRCGRGTK